MRARHRSVLALLSAVTVVGCGGALPRPAPAFDVPDAEALASKARLRIAVVGDVQRTSVLEVWRERNDAERAKILASIASARPDLLVLTGDVVFDGGADGHWEELDRLAAPLREAHIPAVTAFGNHEYWEGRDAAEAHVFPRFPALRGRHATVIAAGPLRILLLDSNVARLGEADARSQDAFYRRALETFDRDPAVRGVFVAMHHPAFTNSTVTGDEPEIQRRFVPPFLAAHKTMAMLAGHVHSYERFVRGEKMFVVSGGGGGPRAALDVGPGRRHPDDRVRGPAIRPFHYTVYTVDEEGVSAEVEGIDKGGSRFAVIDRFVLAWPAVSPFAISAEAR